MYKYVCKVASSTEASVGGETVAAHDAGVLPEVIYMHHIVTIRVGTHGSGI